jgi:fibronectin-binding autotransporter adhesin
MHQTTTDRNEKNEHVPTVPRSVCQRINLSRLLRGGRITRWKGKVASCAPHVVDLFSVPSPHLLAAAMVAALGAAPASAADLYWDTNTTGAGLGGGGTWNTSTSVWTQAVDGVSGPYVPWNNSQSDNAIFGGTAGTVQLGAPISAHNLTFNVDGYSLTDGTLTLTGATPTITAGAGTVTISTAIAGTAGLTKAGAGTLSLSGSNTFSGGVAVNAGTLAVSSDAALGAAGNGITLLANGSSTFTSAGALAATRLITLSGPGVAYVGGGVGSARFTGNGELRVYVNSVALSNNTNDYTGPTTVQASTYGGADLSFSSIADSGVASALGSGSAINIYGGGVAYATAYYTGGAASSNRSWTLSSGQYGYGTLQNQGSGTLTLTGNISLTNNVQFIASTGDIALNGVLSGGGVRLVSAAGRKITIGGANNTYTGNTTIPTGTTVEVSHLADVGSPSSLGMGAGTIILSGSTLSYKGSGDVSNRPWTVGNGVINSDGTGALGLSGNLTIGSGGTATLGGSYVGVNIQSGVVSGSGNLVMNGAAGAIWELDGTNTFTGTTTVQGGTLRIGNTAALGNNTGVTVTGGTLDLNGVDTTIASLAGTGGSVALNGTADLTVNGTVIRSYAGSLTGDGGLIKAGTGTQTLTGQNTYTGATTVSGGTLALNFTSGSPSSNIISPLSTLNMAGGTLTVTGTGQTQKFAATSVTAGSNTIAGSGNTTIDLGAISRSNGLLNFVLPGTGNIKTTPSATLGGWATVTSGTTTDYAQVDGAGNIVARTAYATKDNASTWLTGDVVSDTANATNSPYFGTVGGTVQLGGLKYTAAAPSTVTVGGRLGVDGTIIASSSVGGNALTITGGQLTGPAGGGTLGVLQQGTNGNFTIASTVVDNGGATGFTKAGGGTLTLSGANTYTGATTVSLGTLSVNSIVNGGQASAIGASSAAPSNLVLEGGTLQYTGGTTNSDRGFTVVTNGAVTSGTINVTQTGTNLTFSGPVTSPDNAGLTKSGPGTLTLSNPANTYVGPTTISGGVLAAAALANGGLPSSIGASTSAPANLVLQSGGTLQYTGGTTTTNRGFTLSATGGGGGIGVSDPLATLTVSGTATGAGGLTKSGPGTLELSGTNTYTGSTVVSAGTLRAGSTRAFGGVDAIGSYLGPMNVLAGATLDLANNDNWVGGLIGAGNVTLGSATLTINNNANAFTGAISGTGGVTIAAGTQVMSGCGNSYAGSTRIYGALSVSCLRDGGQASDIGASTSASSNLQISNGTLIYTGGNATTDRGATLGGANLGTINVANSNTTLEFSGVFTGGGLIKTGPGTLLLSGANDYGAGTATIVNGGVLRAGSTSAFGASGLRMDTTGATLDLDGFNNSVAYISQVNTSITGGNITLGSGTLTVSNGGGGVYNGAISGTGGLVKNGGGVQVLSGAASSYTGSTAINGGILAVASLANGGVNSSIGASGAAPGNLVLNGGTLQYNGTGGSTDRQFTLGASGGALDASGTGPINFASTAPVALSGSGNRTLTLTGNNTAANALAARIDNPSGGTTALTKTGSGTWILRNSGSTYTGITTINGGVLAVDKLADGGQASSLGASSNAATNLVIGQNSTLRYTGTGDTTDRQFSLDPGTTIIESSGSGALAFTNTGNVTLNGTNAAHTIALGGTNTGNNTMGGTIADDGTGQTILAKNDSGTWILTGNNTYTGNTVVNDGTLVVGNGGTSGNAGAGNVIVFAPTSTLAMNRSDIFNFNGTLSGAGALAQIGSGTTTLTSAGNSIGATRISAGALSVTGGLDSATISISGSSTLSVSGTVAGAGGAAAVVSGDAGNNRITIAAAGTLRANGDLGGGSDVLTVGGVLETGAAPLSLGAGDDTLSLQGVGNITAGSVDGGTGTDTVLVNNFSARQLSATQVGGFEILNKTGPGTLTLTGDHSYANGVTIGSGLVQVGNGSAGSSLATPSVSNNGTLAFNLPGAYTFGGTISGSGGVSNLGAGTTVLTAANSYTGATQVNAGALLVNGDQSLATGATTVASGATLGGGGTLGGSVTVASGATLSPGAAAGQAGTLAIKGNLTLNPTSTVAANFGQPNVVGGSLNDLVDVGGNLTLDGTLNVTQTPGGTFGPGLYRVMSYGGTLTDNGMTVSPSSGLALQTAVANQVNLVNTAGVTLNFWDGDAGPKFNNAVNGGNGTWRATGDDNWANDSGAVNATYTDASLAVFAGTPGTVTVDDTSGPVRVSGMQFASNGYVVGGDAVALTGTQAAIRVGDGSSAGAGYTATIGSALTGASQLVKTDLGKLVLAGTNTYTGGTLVDDGTLAISADANLGDAAGGVTIDGATLQTTATLASARAVALTGAGTISTDAATTATLTGSITGAGALTKAGAGTLVVAGDAAHTGGTTIAAGTLQVGSGSNTGTLAGNVVDNGTLAFNRADTYTFGGTVSGTGALRQAGAGTTILTANNTYSGGTTIQSGTLQLGAGGTSGMVAGNVVNNGTLAFNRSDVVTFNGLVSGTGALSQDGAGMTILTAANSYGGTTTVNNGTLMIQGNQSMATGATTVNAGATLGGTGIVGGDVTVTDNATVAPGGVTVAPGTLTINGALTLSPNANLAYHFGQANVVGGAYNDLLSVGGDLTLDGALGITQSPGGNFGPGLYRVISYGGTLTDNGLAVSSPDYFAQTSVAQQVNLVNTAGLTLRYWDGAAGTRNDGTIQGGDGVWHGNLGNDNWTDAGGTPNAPFQTGNFAVFAGAPGTVTVDNSQGDITVSGMQFATDGYRVQDGQIALAAPQAIVRVGDGTLAGAGYTATIASTLTGASTLVKTDLGKLVLAGTNTYTGGTTIEGGTVSIAADENLGAAAGGVTLDGGTLQTTADLASARAFTVGANNGTILTDAATTATLTGTIAGAGALAKDGAGTLVVAGDATHTGGTTIAAGTLQVGDGGTSGTLAGDVTNNGTIGFNRSDTSTFAGTVSGTGALRQIGTGTTILTADNSYTGGTTIEAGTLQLGAGGTTGMVPGNVTNNGTLAVNRADTVTLNGTISGSGGFWQMGPGTTILAAANSYSGTTTISGGTLLVQGDQSTATGDTRVAAGTLSGTGVIGGNVSVAGGATLAPGMLSGAPGVLTVKGDLALDPGAIVNVDLGQANAVGGPLNDLIRVGGDLTLNGTLNVAQSAGGSFGPGVYRVISYDGDLLGGTLALGTLPGDTQTTVQTSIAHQVNLVNAATTTLTFWDGDAGGKNDGSIDGGDGVWRATGDDNWTTAAGDSNAAYASGRFPIFAGTPGTVTVDDSAGPVTVSGMQFATGGYTIQGDAIELTGSDDTIRVGDGTAQGAGYVATINAPLTGSAGLTKTDLGTLVLGGKNSYTGPTTVAGGTLSVMGSIANSAVAVQSGATLGGTGTVGATTVASGATVAPGASLGTLSVNGNYVQQAGAVYQAELDPTSNASDRIAVAGTATLADGAVINVTKTSAAPYQPNARYTVLTAAGGLQGSFDLTGDTALSSFLGLTDTYDANNAYLVVQQSRPIASVAETGNQAATAGGVDSLPADNPLKSAVLNLADDASARGALDQLSGEIHASVRTAAIENSRFVRDAAVDRLREAFCGAGAQDTQRQAGQAQDGLRGQDGQCASEKGPTGWVRVFGSWQHTQGDGNAAAMDDSTSGIFVGTDTAVGQNWRVGVMTGYSHSDIDVDGRSASASSDNYHLGVYGGAQWGALGLRTGAAYTWQDISTGRAASFAGVSDTPQANYNAGTTQVFGDLGYRIDAGRFSYEPFVNVAYVNLNTDSFTERGSAAVLHSPGDTSEVIFSTLGLRGSAALNLGGMQGVVRGSLGWRHASGDDKPVATVGFPGGDQFGVAGVRVAQDAAVVNAGLDIHLSKNTVLGVSYDGQFSGSSTAQSVQATFKMMF